MPRSVEDPVGTHEVNVTGTLRVFKAAVDAGVRRVVYSSSSSVYGDQPTLPLTEDMPPAPVNPYACQKWMGEIYAGNFRRTYGLETVCLRYFNVYGPRQVTEGAYRLVIGIFMDQQQRGEPLTIHGDGLQTRDFTWVGDVVRANILAGESERVGAGEPINVGAGSEVSINRIAELVGGPVVHTEPRGFDERFKRAGIQRARDLLGWEPTVQIEEGIQRLLVGQGERCRRYCWLRTASRQPAARARTAPWPLRATCRPLAGGPSCSRPLPSGPSTATIALCGRFPRA